MPAAHHEQVERAVDQRPIHRLTPSAEPVTREDAVTVEEPLEIRVADEAIAVLMRTPGDDLALVAGFLLTEGLLGTPDDLGTLGYCAQSEAPNEHNVVEARLTCGFDSGRFRRNFYATSSCGVCGKASIEQLRTQVEPLTTSFQLPRPVLWKISGALRLGQQVFDRTGALHAAGLFDLTGKLLHLSEDVGRHNAVDKLVGRYVLSGQRVPSPAVLMISGRASFEIVQKAWMAGISMIAAVSGPSTLAVDLADEAGITLIGFLRDQSANLYTHHRRLV